MTVDDTRYANLLTLIEQHGGQRPLADAIGKAPAQISQWVTRAPNERGTARVVSTGTARQIESRLGLAPGWMDADHAPGATAPPATPGFVDPLTPDERALLDLYHGMTPDRRAAWAAAGRALAQPPVKRRKTKS